MSTTNRGEAPVHPAYMREEALDRLQRLQRHNARDGHRYGSEIKEIYAIVANHWRT